jgi:hypothetical protein
MIIFDHDLFEISYRITMNLNAEEWVEECVQTRNDGILMNLDYYRFFLIKLHHFVD